jgi:hypothetical protein
MTSRMVVAYGAMAALALMISGVVAARAAVQNCSIYPERCQYGANGVYYFYPQGYRMPQSTGGSATNGAAWGCVATDGVARARGRSWGYPNKTSASYGALSACAKRGTSCRVVSCNASVHSNYESYVAFSNVHR